MTDIEMEEGYERAKLGDIIHLNDQFFSNGRWLDIGKAYVGDKIDGSFVSIRRKIIANKEELIFLIEKLEL